MIFFKLGTISRLQGVFPPSRMLFNFKCKKVLFKDLSPILLLCMFEEQMELEACDATGRIEGCSSEVINMSS